MNVTYIALGSNMGDRERHLNQALEAIENDAKNNVKSVSSIYEAEPVGLKEQPPFLNMVIELHTTFTATGLLLTLQAIEHQLGRVRTERFGPRTIDLDILLYNDENIEQNELTIPHPRMHERAFVLIPMDEIAPDVVMPTLKRSIEHILTDIPETLRKGVLLWK